MKKNRLVFGIMLAVVSIILGTSQLTTAVYAQSPPQPKMFPLVIPDLWQAVYGQEDEEEENHYLGMRNVDDMGGHSIKLEKEMA